MQEGYHGGGKPKRMTWKQIKEMVANMRKSGIISKKSEDYHEKEEKEADKILEDLENSD